MTAKTMIYSRPAQDEVLSLADASEYYLVTRRTLRRWAASGQVASERRGTELWFRVAALERAAARQPDGLDGKV